MAQQWSKCQQKRIKLAHCDICGAEINVGHGGVNDIRKHMVTAKHQEMAKVASSLRILFRQSPIEESIARAEVLLVNFITEHNFS